MSVTVLPTGVVLRRRWFPPRVAFVYWLSAWDRISSEWRDCRRRNSGDTISQTIKNEQGENCFLEFDKTEDLLKRLDTITLPSSLGEVLVNKFADAREVIRKTEVLLIKDSERTLKMSELHQGPKKRSDWTGGRKMI